MAAPQGVAVESQQPTLGAGAIQSLLADVYKDDTSSYNKPKTKVELRLPRQGCGDTFSAAAHVPEDKGPDTYSQRPAIANTVAFNAAFREKAKVEAEARRRYAAWEANADAEAIEMGWRDELDRREREALDELVDAARAIEERHGRRRRGTTSRPPPAVRGRFREDQARGSSERDDEEVGVRAVRKAHVRQIV